MKKRLLIFVTLLMSVTAFSQTVLNQKVTNKLMDAVYEVVVEKLPEGEIKYEKELPMDRIPFSIRNDKYNPIGTAFLMEDGKFYSAAHVLSLTEKSFYNEYFLRDKNGATYKISKIEKFSRARDFVVFSVDGIDVKKAVKLKAAPEQELNTTVYSVGNALGDGIVIRDGIYTSQTFEDTNGEWKWLRFSAAASPGNSGGPLVNSDGNVLGIITMKSMNENLNYALPITEIKNVPDNKGVINLPSYYRMPNIEFEKFYHVYNYTIDLPKTIGQVQNESYELFIKDVKSIIKDKIFEKYNPLGPNGFVKEEPYVGLMDTQYYASFPQVCCITEKGEWDAFKPSNVQSIDLENEGKIFIGSMFNYLFAKIEKPENVTVEELLKNPDIYCDYILKALGLTRNVAGEKILITSLGRAQKSESFIDDLDRKWFVNYYDLPFIGGMFMTVALPVPNGLVVFGVLDTVAQVLMGHCFDVQFVANYVIPGYEGTSKQWKEFLAISKDLNPHYDVQKLCSFEQKEEGLKVTCDNMSYVFPKKFDLKDDSCTQLFLGYCVEDGKLKLKPFGMDTFVGTSNEDYISVYFEHLRKPLEGSKKERKDDWDLVVNSKGMYSGKEYTNNGYRYVYLPMKKDLENDCVYIFSTAQSEFVKSKEFMKNSKMLIKSAEIK